MLDIQTWTSELSEKLLALFGERLLFMGLQGSYARGEAHEGSDIDIVAILDALFLDDLKAYRDCIAAMEQGALACGFICGKRELYGWPKYDLFQLRMDTRPIVGSLEPLIPKLAQGDLVDGVRVDAGNLYHGCCHGFLYGDRAEDLRRLKGLYKSTFFILQKMYLLNSGEYVLSREKLLPLLSGADKDVLETALSLQRGEAPADMEGCFDKLLKWCQGILGKGF